MIGRAKGLEMMILNFLKFKCIYFKSVFDHKNYGFENVHLTKNVHVYVIEGMNV